MLGIKRSWVGWGRRQLGLVGDQGLFMMGCTGVEVGVEHDGR